MDRHVVYIAHPLNAETRKEIDANRARASRWCAWAAGIGVAPVADWIILSGEWSESPENREISFEIDKSLISKCHEVWLVGGRISGGMLIEARFACEIGVGVRDMSKLGPEPPDKWTLLDVVSRAHLWRPL